MGRAQNGSGGGDDLGVTGGVLVLVDDLNGNNGSSSGESGANCGVEEETGVRGRRRPAEKRVGDAGRVKQNGGSSSSPSSDEGGGVASLTGLGRHSLGSCFGILLERRGCGIASEWLRAADGRSSRDQQVRAG